jgi:hypothetical protein
MEDFEITIFIVKQDEVFVYTNYRASTLKIQIVFLTIMIKRKMGRCVGSILKNKIGCFDVSFYK